MPYMKQSDRNKWISNLGLLREIMRTQGVSVSDLNFMIAYMCQSYLKYNGNDYQSHCEIEGVLQGISKTFYRKFTEPYEDNKIEENGDIDISY